jgi:hypothetical protein
MCGGEHTAAYANRDQVFETLPALDYSADINVNSHCARPVQHAQGMSLGQGHHMFIKFAALGCSLRMALTGQKAQGNPADDSKDRVEERIEELRQVMIDCLGPTADVQCPGMLSRIRASHDAPSLWYLRSPLMRTLCDIYGEQGARRRIESISFRFEGLLPEGLSSRPSPLSE